MQQTDTARSASQFVSWGWRAGRALLDFLLPPACLCCDEAVGCTGPDVPRLLSPHEFHQ